MRQGGPEAAHNAGADRSGANRGLALVARNLTKSFTVKGAAPAKALDDVSISLAPGEILGLVGPDGAGKTTLLRILAGLVDADAGSIEALGRPIAALDRAALGYLPQNGGVYGDLSVIENLRLFARLKYLPRAQEAGAIARILDVAGLAPFADRLAGRLSGGMRMKLAVGCAMVAGPRLFLLDEPSVGVDPVSRADMWALVQQLAQAGGDAAIIWATSNLEEAERADRIVLLHEGIVRYTGAPADFAARSRGRVFAVTIGGTPGRRVLSAALQSPDIIDGTVQGSALRLVLAPGALPPEQGPLSHLNVMRSVPVAARLEDSFIAALGGAKLGQSALASTYQRQDVDDPLPAIRADRLTKAYGAFKAADGISFDVRRGEIFGLLGPNGAGKSTCFKMLCGLISPTSGQGEVNGFDLASARADARQSLGYMAQRFSLYADLSVAQNLDFFAGAYALSGAGKRAAIAHVTDVFGLGPYLGQDAGALPLGYKQRLSLACAVMHQPPVLFLDEPTSGVDPLVRREFWSHINGLAGRGVTIFVTTHFMDEAEYCDRIAVIFRGQLIALGAPDALKADAAAELAANVADVTLEQAFVQLITSKARSTSAMQQVAA